MSNVCVATESESKMSESDHEAEEGSRAGEEHGDLVDTAPRGRLLPLNLRRLTSAHMKQIAERLGLPLLAPVMKSDNLLKANFKKAVMSAIYK